MDFIFYDANAHRIDDFKHGNMVGLDEVLEADDYDVIGIGGLITSYNYIKAAVRRCKDKQPHAKIIAGGGFFSAIPSDIMSLMPEIDYGVIGEAYVSFPELLSHIEESGGRAESGNDPLPNGCVSRHPESGELVFSEPRQLIPDMDWLPFPAYKYAPLDIYFKYSGLLLSEISMTARKRLDANMSLSCPFLCRFSVSSGTRVSTEMGLIKIEEVAKPTIREECEHGYSVLSESVDFRTPEGKATKIIDEGEMPVWNIILKNGFSVKTTSIHELLVARAGELCWVQTKDLKVGDWVALSKGGLFPDKFPELLWTLYRTKNPWALLKQENKVKLPNVMSPELGWLLGFLIGDGSIHKSGWNLHFAVDEKNYLKLTEVCLKLFNTFPKLYPIKHTTKIQQAILFSAEIVDFVCQISGLSHDNKHFVPEVIFKSPKSVVLEFIRGLWDADSYTPMERSAYETYLVAKSSVLSKGVAMLLQQCGYAAYVYHLAKPDQNRIYKRKLESDPIPTDRGAYWLDGKVRFRGISRAHEPTKRGIVTLRRNVLKQIDPNHPLLGYWYSQVKEVVYEGVSNVWDISVPTSSRFVANGIIVHNCWDLGITSVRPLKTDSSGTVQVIGGRPGKDSVVRQHSPEYIGRYISWLRSSFLDIPYNDAGEGVGYPIDFVAWMDENIVAHDAQTRFTWLRGIKDEFWRRGLVPDCVKKGRHHDPNECSGPHFGGTMHAGLIKKDMLDTMREIGFVYGDFGLESWDADILHNIGKGATPKKNAEAITLTMEAGMAPIPNQIIMFPDESWKSIYTMLDAWEATGITTVPFIATPYPGAEWFEQFRDFILEQYNGSLNDFLSDLQDATAVSALITRNFSAAEAVGIQAIMGEASRSRDFARARRLLRLSEREWQKRRGIDAK